MQMLEAFQVSTETNSDLIVDIAQNFCGVGGRIRMPSCCTVVLGVEFSTCREGKNVCLGDAHLGAILMYVRRIFFQNTLPEGVLYIRKSWKGR